MRRKKSKAPGAFYTFIVSLFLLISNYQSAVQRIKFLFFRTPISLRKLQFIWSTDPASLISVAVFPSVSSTCHSMGVLSFLSAFCGYRPKETMSPAFTRRSVTGAFCAFSFSSCCCAS